MIYTNFIDLHFLVCYAKFQNHRPSGAKIKAIYGHADHLGNVIFNIL